MILCEGVSEDKKGGKYICCMLDLHLPISMFYVGSEILCISSSTKIVHSPELTCRLGCSQAQPSCELNPWLG